MNIKPFKIINCVNSWISLYSDFKNYSNIYKRLPSKYKRYLAIKYDEMKFIKRNIMFFEVDNIHFSNKELDEIQLHYCIKYKRLLNVVITGVANE